MLIFAMFYPFMSWSLNLVRTIVPTRSLSKKPNRMANSIDPNETVHYQDLHYLQRFGLVFRAERVIDGHVSFHVELRGILFRCLYKF